MNDYDTPKNDFIFETMLTFVSDVVCGFIRVYDEEIPIRIVISGPKLSLSNQILKKLADLNPVLSQDDSDIFCSGGSIINIFNRAEFIKSSACLKTDVVFLCDPGIEEVVHSLKLLSFENDIGRLITI